MLRLLRIVLLFLIGVLMVAVVVALASDTGVVEWAALLAAGVLLFFVASRVWRIGAGSRTDNRSV